MPRIDLDDVSLTFTLRKTRNVTLKEYLLKGLFLKKVNPTIAVHALSRVTLHAGDGDRVGIIGHNGAGKSTLLKLLAGVYPPTSGTVKVTGKICSLFDIALGFEPEATGWENINYRGFLQGETPRTLKGKKDAIAEFSELGEFLNLPVRYYSAGMMVRLAFSIATAVEPEVLLIDEVLGVGDMAFQQKAKERMRGMMAKARVMVMVSHDLGSIASFCNRVLWMQHGTVMQEGPPDEVIEAYTRSVAPTGEAHPVGAMTESDGEAPAEALPVPEPAGV